WTGRLSNGDIPVLAPHDHYSTEVQELISASPALTAADAIGDLPPIVEHLQHMEARRGARRFANPITYKGEATNHYQQLMRNWPNLASQGTPADHVIRFTPRDYETFRLMSPGDQYPQAHEIALQRLAAALTKEEKDSGSKPREGGQRYEALK